MQVRSKYEEKGAYHWLQYRKKKSKYRRHVDYVLSWMKGRAGKILDVGAGDGVITYYLRAVGIDNDLIAVELAKQKEAFVIPGDAYHLPFDNDTFSTVYFGDTIEHLEEPGRSLAEIRRVLRLDGSLFVATPPQALDGEVKSSQHYREYTDQELEKEVCGTGFELQGKIDVRRDLLRMYGRFINRKKGA